MSKKVVNLTRSMVERELDSLLDMYPHKLHQLRSPNSDLRQELLAYVLNRVPSVYKTQSDRPSDDNSNYDLEQNLEASLELQMQIETLVFQGINYLAPEKHSDLVCA